jgi:acetyltransferase-like isoleucine patch superfamily enzyme
MNKLTRYWLTWKHARKFARLGAGSKYPIPDLTIRGHAEMGEHCRMRNNATLVAHGDGKVIFGTRSGLSWGCFIEANELVQLGDYTAVAEFTYITDTIHHLAGNTGSKRDARIETRPVRIGNACFIGSSCFIGPGVTIGDGAVVAHHSVVTQDIGPLEIWGGVPARKMGHRTENVPAAKLREFERLVAEQGIQRDRYQDDD